MAEFLSPAWVRAVDVAVAGVDLATAVGDATAVASCEGLCLDQLVIGAEGDAVTGYRWTVRDGRLRVTATTPEGEPDPTGGALARLTTDRSTAFAIAIGQQSAQGAFMAGLLRVGGDPTVLTRLQPVFVAVDTALAPVRRATIPPPGP